MTKELKELVAFGLACGELIADMAVGKFIEAVKLAGPGLAGAKDALQEYVDMSDAEAKDLENFVVQEFDISDDVVEAAVEGALNVAIELHELVKLFVKKP